MVTKDELPVPNTQNPATEKNMNKAAASYGPFHSSGDGSQSGSHNGCTDRVPERPSTRKQVNKPTVSPPNDAKINNYPKRYDAPVHKSPPTQVKAILDSGYKVPVPKPSTEAQGRHFLLSGQGSVSSRPHIPQETRRPPEVPPDESLDHVNGPRNPNGDLHKPLPTEKQSHVSLGPDTEYHHQPTTAQITARPSQSSSREGLEFNHIQREPVHQPKGPPSDPSPLGRGAGNDHGNPNSNFHEGVECLSALSANNQSHVPLGQGRGNPQQDIGGSCNDESSSAVAAKGIPPPKQQIEINASYKATDDERTCSCCIKCCIS